MAPESKGAGSASDSAAPATAAAGSHTAPSSGQAGAGFTPTIRTTKPEKILRHDISDEDLEMFMHNNSDGLSEAFWACIGGVVAALPSTIAAIHDSYGKANPEPLTVFHLIEIIIFTCFLIGAAIIWKINKNKGGSTAKLVTAIRARKES